MIKSALRFNSKLQNGFANRLIQIFWFSLETGHVRYYSNMETKAIYDQIRRNCRKGLER